MKCKFCENETEPGSTVCEDCCKEAVETTEWIDKRPTMKMKPTPETTLAAIEFANATSGDGPFPLGVSAAFAADMERQRDELLEQRDNLLEWLDTLTLVVGLTPIAGNKEALQEAMNGARAAIAATKPEAEANPWDGIDADEFVRSVRDGSYEPENSPHP